MPGAVFLSLKVSMAGFALCNEGPLAPKVLQKQSVWKQCFQGAEFIKAAANEHLCQQ